MTAPVLLLLGAHSEIRSRFGGDATDERLRQSFKDVRIANVADAGHMMHHERPEEVARLIEDAEQRWLEVHAEIEDIGEL